MTLLQLIVLLLAVGVTVALVETHPTMSPTTRLVVRIFAAIVAIVAVLYALGLVIPGHSVVVRVP